MLSPREIYFAEEEFNRFEEIMNTKLYLTKEEYDFCFHYDESIKGDVIYVGLSDQTWSVETIRKLIYSALDLVIVVERDSGGKRTVSEVSEIAGLESGGFLFHSLYKNNQQNISFAP